MGGRSGARPHHSANPAAIAYFVVLASMLLHAEDPAELMAFTRNPYVVSRWRPLVV